MRSILAVAAVIALAAGCGGGGKRLSRAEFSKQADAICSKYNAKIRALVVSISPLASLLFRQTLTRLHNR